jgi:hypothetical protein
MAEVTTVRITYGQVSATVQITYRWYVPGNDPWRRTSGVGVVPYGGDWENRAISGSTSNVRMYDSSAQLVMILSGFTRISRGSTGTGEFYASGYSIPEYSSFDWEVTAVRR